MNLTMGEEGACTKVAGVCARAGRRWFASSPLCKMSRNRVTREVCASGRCINTRSLNQQPRDEKKPSLVFLAGLPLLAFAFRLCQEKLISFSDCYIAYWFHGQQHAEYSRQLSPRALDSDRRWNREKERCLFSRLMIFKARDTSATRALTTRVRAQHGVAVHQSSRAVGSSVGYDNGTN